MTSKKVARNHWFKIPKYELLIILGIYLLSFLINWYKIPDNLFFGHEQGRDAQAIRDIYTGKHFPLIGTKTEVEGFYSPPWYYYIMSIPYGFSGGNPTAGILTIVLFNSTVPPVMYFFIKDILKSAKWGIAGGIMTALSWEFINYARWLINVSPAYPFIALSLFMAWKYYKNQRPLHFFLYALFAILAFQFQITLIFQFAFLTIILIVLRFFKLPNFKTIVLSIAVALFLASPLIVFDFRHDHITIKSTLGFVIGKQDKSLTLNLQTSISQYVDQMRKVTRRTLFNANYNSDNIYPRQSSTYLQVAFFLTLFFGLYFFAKGKANRKTLLFVLVISFMSLGILPFNIGLTQLYEGTGVGWVILETMSLYALMQSSKTRILAVVLITLVTLGWIQNLKYLEDNDDWFFVPLQKVLTYHDQVALINFMQNDAKVKPYRFESFTVPYLHSEGWQYLHSYLYPTVESKHAKEAYISIEPSIEPFWERKWIEDLGKTDFVYEKNFGLIRLQKRLIKNPT